MNPGPSELETLASDTIKRVINQLPVEGSAVLILCGAAMAASGQTAECNRLRSLAARLGATPDDLFPRDEASK